MDSFSRTKIYFKVRQTTIEMLEDRGYIVTPEDRNLSYQNFADKLEENQINIVSHHSKNENRMVYVSYILEGKTFSKKDLTSLKEYVDENFAQKEISVIVIVQEKPTPQLMKELLNDEFKMYEIFLTKNLMINITHHEIVPKHILLSEEEASKVLDEYDATKSQLPKILSTDPVAKYYGMKVGDICKIVRHSPMTGESYYYRMVK